MKKILFAFTLSSLALLLGVRSTTAQEKLPPPATLTQPPAPGTVEYRACDQPLK